MKLTSFIHTCYLLLTIGGSLVFSSTHIVAADLDYLSRADRLNGWKTLESFKDWFSSQRPSVVEILDDGKQVGLGTIVSTDGLIVTKASEFGHSLEVRLFDYSKHIPELVSVDEANDLALLKIGAHDLQPVEWSDSSNPDMGQWVISPHEDETQVRIGVVSTSPRELPKQFGALGVVTTGRRDIQSENNLLESNTELNQLKGRKSGALILEVVNDSAAEESDLKSGDLIMEVNSKIIGGSEDLTRLVREHGPGETINLSILRDGEQLKKKVTLGYFDSTFPDQDVNIALSGEISDRRRGFQEVIQHDIPLPPKSMGGPLFTLEGKVIGINIARFDRVATFALPSTLVQSLIEKLK